MAGKKTGKPKEIGTPKNEKSILTQLKEVTSETKMRYICWLYAKELLPQDFETLEDLKAYYPMIPKGVTEKTAKRWLLEDSVQKATKMLLKAKHGQKMIELYNIYYEKAKDDTNAFKAFTDFSQQFFADSKETELQAILKGVKLEDGDN